MHGEEIKKIIQQLVDIKEKLVHQAQHWTKFENSWQEGSWRR